MKQNPDYPEILRPIDHLELAYQFLEAYKFGHNTRPPNFPRYFLACHSVELVIKAFLLKRGMSENDKQFLKHDLVALLERAIGMGIVVDDEIKSEIAELNDVHNNFWHRYPRTYAKPIILIHQFDKTIETLFEIIRNSFSYSPSTHHES